MVQPKITFIVVDLEKNYYIQILGKWTWQQEQDLGQHQHGAEEAILLECLLELHSEEEQHINVELLDHLMNAQAIAQTEFLTANNKKTQEK